MQTSYGVACETASQIVVLFDKSRKNVGNRKRQKTLFWLSEITVKLYTDKTKKRPFLIVFWFDISHQWSWVMHVVKVVVLHALARKEHLNSILKHIVLFLVHNRMYLDWILLFNPSNCKGNSFFLNVHVVMYMAKKNRHVFTGFIFKCRFPGRRK